jgi:phosphonate transport system permease protein
MGSVIMPVIETADTRLWQRRDSRTKLTVWSVQLFCLIVFTYCWSLVSEKTIWEFVYDAPTQASDMASRMVPPAWNYMDMLWLAIWDTINIATLGTLMAIVMAFPIAFLAARNTTPSKAFIRPIALFIIVSSRSINSLLWALMLVTIIGPGVLAGVLAIGFRSIGFCAKLLYEAIEEIDVSQVEAVTATGASGPQILPVFVGISLFRWDINIRESTVLGLVGAGGIGLQLSASINTVAWTQVSMILLVILSTVIVSEWVSAKVRHAII